MDEVPNKAIFGGFEIVAHVWPMTMVKSFSLINLIVTWRLVRAWLHLKFVLTIWRSGCLAVSPYLHAFWTVLVFLFKIARRARRIWGKTNQTTTQYWQSTCTLARPLKLTIQASKTDTIIKDWYNYPLQSPNLPLNLGTMWRKAHVGGRLVIRPLSVSYLRFLTFNGYLLFKMTTRRKRERATFKVDQAHPLKVDRHAMDRLRRPDFFDGCLHFFCYFMLMCVIQLRLWRQGAVIHDCEHEGIKEVDKFCFFRKK